MKRLIQLGHITLTPNLLFGTSDAVATHGVIHATAPAILEVDGKEYNSNDPNERPDLLIGLPALAQLARELFTTCAQKIADDAGCPVQYKVNGEIRTVEPQQK